MTVGVGVGDGRRGHERGRAIEDLEGVAGDVVDAVAELEELDLLQHVGAVAACHQVLDLAVEVRLEGQLVFAESALIDRGVEVLAAIDVVITAAAVDPVVAVIALDLVVGEAAEQRVAAALAEEVLTQRAGGDAEGFGKSGADELDIPSHELAPTPELSSQNPGLDQCWELLVPGTSGYRLCNALRQPAAGVARAGMFRSARSGAVVKK